MLARVHAIIKGGYTRHEDIGNIIDMFQWSNFTCIEVTWGWIAKLISLRVIKNIVFHFKQMQKRNILVILVVK